MFEIKNIRALILIAIFVSITLSIHVNKFTKAKLDELKNKPDYVNRFIFFNE
jgi:hypothetical protein